MDYTVEGEDAEVVQSPDQISVISAPVAKPEETQQEVIQDPGQVQMATLGYCITMYDYDADAPDELNLDEGQV